MNNLKNIALLIAALVLVLFDGTAAKIRLARKSGLIPVVIGLGVVVALFAFLAMVATVAISGPTDNVEQAATTCPGGSCEPLPTKAQGCEHSQPGHNPHCNTPTVSVPTPEVATATNTPIPPTKTNTPIPPTATNTPEGPTATPTNTPEGSESTATPTATPTREDAIITVTITPTATMTRTLALDLPDGGMCAPAVAECEFCCPGAEENQVAQAGFFRSLTRIFDQIADFGAVKLLQDLFGGE